jgi:hypothetical protein
MTFPHPYRLPEQLTRDYPANFSKKIPKKGKPSHSISGLPLDVIVIQITSPRNRLTIAEERVAVVSSTRRLDAAARNPGEDRAWPAENIQPL